MELLGKQAILEEAIMHLERDAEVKKEEISRDNEIVKSLRVLYKVL